MERLKPCPWCGNDVTIEYQCGLQYSMPQWRVQCPECGTMAEADIVSPNIAGKARVRKFLAKDWNEKRADALADKAAVVSPAATTGGWHDSTESSDPNRR